MRLSPMELVFQSTNSPDLNMLNGEFFSFIQSLLNLINANNTHHQVSAVLVASQETSFVTLDKVLLSSQYRLEDAIKWVRGNEYCMPHEEKKKAFTQSYIWLQKIERTADVYNYKSQSLHGLSSALKLQYFAELQGLT